MTSPATTRGLLLERAAERCERRLVELDKAIEAGDMGAWEEYLVVAKALAVLAPATLPERTGALLTTEQMAQRLGISSKTLLRRKKRGELAPALTLGRRGRAALRWRGTEAG